MGKKYKLLHRPGNCQYNSTQIQAVRDFKDVKAGDLGGYVNSENNLSHNGTCWVYDQACALGNSRILDDASLHGDSYSSGHTIISENATLYDKSGATGNARIYGNATLFNNSRVIDYARVHDNAKIGGYVWISNSSVICDNANIYGNFTLTGNSNINGNTIIQDIDYPIGYLHIILSRGYWNILKCINEELYLISSTLETMKIHWRSQ